MSGVLKDRTGEVLHIATTKDGYIRLPVALDAVDPAFVQALIAMEDRRFLGHAGVDPLAILRAFKSNASAGYIVSGASTITQQLGRQYKPRPRTYRTKMVEAADAIRLDLRMSKSEQLTRYLTRISYGGNVQGVESAAQVWLGKAARYLRPDEIALLLAIPQSPEARRPDRNPVAAKAGRDRILDRMVIAGLIDADQAAIAKRQPLSTRRHDLPDGNFLALEALGPGQSYLDADLQDHVRSQLSAYVDVQPIPVNAAAMIVHAPSREVRALVGTGARNHGGGWIDMTDRLRSPGSTLKPFIYGLARDDGALDFASNVSDAPTRFGTYRPENFTRRYHGTVRVAEALQHSLNVPAVAVLDGVGADRFRAVLRAAGPQTRGRLGDDDSEGLALALGGTGLSARDLAVLYTALANDGQAAPLRYKLGDPVGQPYPLVSIKTARQTLSVLRGAPRPKGVPNMPGLARLAYKTGTSYGHRDSWAAGVIGDYVIIVWTGRPDGAPRPGRTGRETAAPLLFDIATPLQRLVPARSDREIYAALSALADLTPKEGTPPQILFPSDGSDVVTDLGEKGRGLSISVESDHAVRIFVEGQIVQREAGQSIWQPSEAGFYRITAIDADGRSANADIRVIARDQFRDAPF